MAGRMKSALWKNGRRGARPATPHELVGRTYDLAIRACRKGEAEKSEKAILLLRELMRAVGPEDSADVLKFYDWCVKRIRADEFDAAVQTLTDLRAAWEQAERRFPA
ncbi:MAG: hypothetical protein JW929_02085 [Anaerolineales bacterium]|nr:hypothetical protein [Anaerolineales bacterium]